MTTFEMHGRRPRPWRSKRKQAQQDWEAALTYAAASLKVGDEDIREEAFAMLHTLGGNAERWRRATCLALTRTAGAIEHWPANGKPQEPRKTLRSEPFREARDQTNTSMFQRTT